MQKHLDRPEGGWTEEEIKKSRIWTFKSSHSDRSLSEEKLRPSLLLIYYKFEIKKGQHHYNNEYPFRFVQKLN